MSEARDKHVCKARRVVVKVGTNVLAAPGGHLDDARVRAVAEQMAWLVRSGRQVVLVSSGAIGCGMAELGLERRPTALPLLQAIASVGQGTLVARYERHFRRHGLHAAQVLLTRDDFDDRSRYLNAANTMRELLNMSCVPVVNENDAISTDEIRFGDNDKLAALVAHMVRAELLVLLTSVPGVYVKRPRGEHPGEVLDVVARLDEDVERLVYEDRTPDGMGGMASKIEAARMVTRAGEAALIADGREPGIVESVFGGERVGTLFLPAARRLRSRKRWLRFTGRPRGTLAVDDGARKAVLNRGKSLLPSGVVRVEGVFRTGDVVRVAGPEGREFARGLSNFSAEDVERIKGLRTSEIGRVLGHKDYDEVIHRDNLVLLD